MVDHDQNRITKTSCLWITIISPILIYFLSYSLWIIYYKYRLNLSEIIQLNSFPQFYSRVFWAIFIGFSLFYCISLLGLRKYKSAEITVFDRLPYYFKTIILTLVIHLVTYLFIGKSGLGFLAYISTYSFFLASSLSVVISMLLMNQSSIENNLSRILSTKRLIILIVLGFFAIYVTFSTLYHYTFNTVAWDFGDYDQAVWKISQLKMPENSIIGRNNLGDHFELPLVYLAPLYWVWNSPYVLLISQALFIAIGIIPIFLLAYEKLNSRLIASLLSMAYGVFFGIQAALAFDFHPLVMAIPFLAFSIYFLFHKKYQLLIISLLLALITKENIALYIIFFGIYMMLFTKVKKLGLLVALLSLGYFLLIVNVVMPALTHGETYLHFVYKQFGNSYTEAIMTMISHPVFTIQTLFTPEIKSITLYFLFGSFMFLPLFSGRFLVLMFPLIIERFLSSKSETWLPEFHYSAIWAVYIAIGAITGIHNLINWTKQHHQNKYLFTLILVFATFISSVLFSFRGNTYAYALWRIPSLMKNTTSVRINHLYEAIEQIPQNSSIRAQDMLVSHLSHRENIYLLTNYGNTEEYVFMDIASSTWPLNRSEFRNLVKEYISKNEYGIVYNQGSVLLLKKGYASNLTLSSEVAEFIKTGDN